MKTNFEEISKRDSENLSGVNRIHHYPAKMATELGNYFIQEYTGKRKGTMFDPFCGSGTTLLLSKLNGFDVYGCDMLKVAVQVSKAKSLTLGPTERQDIREFQSDLEITRPNHLDDWENRRMWFNDEVYLDLMGIRNEIEKYEGEQIYPALFVSLSNVVWEVSSADADILVPTRSKKSKTRPFYSTSEIKSMFRETLTKILGIQQLHDDNVKNEKAVIKKGDAKTKETWPGSDFDMILTSPPYGDGINYRRSVSLQTRFFGLEDKIHEEKTTKHLIGRKYYHLSEDDDLAFDKEYLERPIFEQIKQNNPDRVSTVITYLDDMKVTLENMTDRLNNDGLIGLVIGNPEVAGNRVPLHELIIDLANDSGLELADDPKKDEIVSRFQTPVRRSSNEPIRYEYLILLRHD